MPVFLKKKEKETTGSFLRRFTRRVQQSHVLVEARKKRYHRAEPTKRQKKLSALYRIQKTKEMERQRKLGLLKEEEKPYKKYR
ncbi:hypothetical protein A2W39_03385 [Candidatus Azambacteria bacterium RIFCSPHIGHO2_01_46_10]|uniref:30S ribosomal protein S21 n=4 Tax=Candidatus Azamiibacteriota TaxID=1752741 RepID=A0A1F5BYU7_9BACT|nr:MAG: hypothetical protein UX51_C0009G0001 [Candidatus Azambacteria bacterium GW2011_GWF2_46_32]KKU42803.1 MAG: hypothetical protein UX56_C0006G0022 [Candidatus Azambacteria bacterium GW2011_GWD2_46_48]OGD29992.1 MAG: hypothetical protein A2W60_01660 [Candidatus Azambacteria bacterium RIFCSPHIGHO2_02_46_12]OGD35792.1 MAG: hypothetical protein A2W39_03385 [Candidatus Azambacteria bacterium RIFCSPHIGHO2_01_46_10]HAM95414.1 hypothetical protein [Candidatus Azambacteria bacterium]